MKSKLPALPVVAVAIYLLLAPRPTYRNEQPAAPPATAAVANRNTQAAVPTPVLAQATAPPATKTVGDSLISQAAAQLERRESISARLRYQLYLGSNELYGLGSYWQKGAGEDLHVRLELQIAGQEADLLQVSNSRFLWIERRLPIGRTVTRLDLRQLRAEATFGGSTLGDIQPGNASWTSPPAELIAHAGGLPSLLFALGDSFTFLPPQTMRLASKPDAGQQTTSIPFFAVVGHWRKEKLAKLLVADPATGEKPIPARLPEEVLILIGQADLFPYRLEYRKQETPIAANQAGAAIPYQLSSSPMVVLEFTDIAFDVPIEPGQFNYTPGDVEWTDRTAAILEKLKSARNGQMAGRSPTEPVNSRR
jgi:hypothetical protein